MPPAGPWSEAALEALESDAVRRVREMHARYQATGRSNELPYDKRPGGIQAVAGGADDISLAVGLPDEDSVPRQVLEDCMREGAFASADRSMWGYRGGTAGWEPLRAALAEHFTRRRGHPVAATNLMIDGGSGGAIASVVRAFLSPGDVVLVERPSYTTTFHCFEAVGARVVGVDLDGEGPVLAQIEEAHRALQAQGGSTPKLLYTQGLYHNPRGKGYSERRMRQLLQLCRRLGLLICNDEAYYGLDLGSGDDQQQPMSALEGSEGVLTCGTFSKTVAPGLRVGWVLGHEALVQRCDLLRFDNGISTVLLAGLGVFVSKGLWDAQIDKVQTLYRRKMLAFTGALREHCADFLSFQEPRGGFYIWAELRDGLSLEAVSARAADLGVVARGGTMYWHVPTLEGEWPAQEEPPLEYRRHLRLCFSQPSEDELVEAARRLGQACEACVAEHVRANL